MLQMGLQTLQMCVNKWDGGFFSIHYRNQEMIKPFRCVCGVNLTQSSER